MRNLLLMMVLANCVWMGCKSPNIKAAAHPGTALAARNNGYSLLHQLLDENKDISWLHFIKKEDSELKSLMKKIATACGSDSALLEKFAKSDPSIILDDLELPPAEVATRNAIAASKKDAILGRSGDAFELTLLLSQAEALSYAWHLAKVTAENETQPEHAHALESIGDEMESLYGQVFVLLRSRESLSARK
jgi:hypothetical protein